MKPAHTISLYRDKFHKYGSGGNKYPPLSIWTATPPFLTTEGCERRDIHRRMSIVYGKLCPLTE